MSILPPASRLTSSRIPTRETVVANSDTAQQRPRSVFSGHLPALDGVRGLAILGVLLFHFVAPTNPKGPVDTAITWLFSYGALGVNLFFVLSGFLITGILYDSRADPAYFRNFYMRRVLRIFPLYYGVLAIVFLAVPAIPALHGSEIAGLKSHQAWAWLYGVNIYLAIHGGWVLSYIEHFWSLAIEEQFYLVWPLVVWLLGAKRRLFLTFSLAAAIASFVSRIVASLLGAGPIATTVLTPFQLDSLAIGGFLAVYLRQPDAVARARGIIVPMTVAGGGLLLLQFGVRHFSEFGDAVESLRTGAFHLLLAALLAKALSAPSTSGWSRFFRSSPMVMLGKYSYGIYVYHHFFSYYFSKHDTESALASVMGSHIAALVFQAVGGMAASMAIAWLSYEYFEKYFLQLKRFWPSSTHPGKGASLWRDPGGGSAAWPRAGSALRAWEEELPEARPGGAIPRIIHQTFPSRTMPAVLQQNLARIKSLNPGWEHRLYDDADIVEFIRSSFGPRVLAQYDRINPKYGAARADLFRYLLMYRVGGVYLDIKSTVRKPLDEVLLPGDVYVLSHWGGAQFRGWGNYRVLRPFGGKEFQQWHIIAAAGHPFLRAVVARVLHHLETYNPFLHDTGRMGVTWSTGPIAYTLAIAPLLSRHRHRIVGGHEELGLEYSVFGGADRAHKAAFRHHYTELNEPVVRLRGAIKVAWFVLGPIQVQLLDRLRRLHTTIARRLSPLLSVRGPQ